MVNSDILHFSLFTMNLRSKKGFVEKDGLYKKEGFSSSSSSKARLFIVPSAMSLRKLNRVIADAKSMFRLRVSTPLSCTTQALHQVYKPTRDTLFNTEGKELLRKSKSCLERGNQVILSSEGCGGVYFICDHHGVPLSVFKPRNEEYMTPHNPRGYVRSDAVIGETEHAVNQGFITGDGALNELAAYLLDYRYGGFSDVPTTILTELDIHSCGRKTQGALQRYVKSCCSAEDIGTMRFDLSQVQRIGILDLRLFNTDRHSANILLTERKGESLFDMTPIDHGYCLPSWKHLESATFDWLYWPQAKFPFPSSTLDYIASLKPEEDAILLRSLHLDEDSITTMRICTLLLQLGADAGLSLYNIGSMVERKGDGSRKSQVELAVDQVCFLMKHHQEVDQMDKRQVGDFLVLHLTKRFKEMVSAQPHTKQRSVSCY